MKAMIKFWMPLLLTALPIFQASGAAPDSSPPQVSVLKKSMISFQDSVAKLQMLQSKNEWDQVAAALKSLRASVEALKRSDPGLEYPGAILKVSLIVSEMESLQKMKDPALFDKIPSLTQSCLQCHSAHRVLGVTDTKH